MTRKSEILLYRWIKPHYHIVLVLFFTIMAMVLGYAISVATEGVYALFPYISDTGTKPPASCVFGLMLNLASVFAFTTMFIRHRYFEKYNSIDSHRIHVINDVCLFFGSLSAFGMMLVANFQELNQLTMHIIGAVLTFALGLLYCAIQCYLTFVTIPVGLSNKFQLCMRCGLVLIACVAFIGTFSAASAAQMESSKHNSTHHTTINLDWESDDPGYSAHLVSTFSEWIMVISFIFFFSTFFKEFQNIEAGVHFECYMFAGETTPIVVSATSNMLETEPTPLSENI